ncbi:hypothetical protein JTE90_026331 [Oedothorax gibbosus]|uniref:Uncharacterized protein n=1 Tax=Oedothorax gibbosus TaxID=931172 RepID=A0AAV6U661_9ARAC|nr:hypothetical protein JTE90_026331 [Oedothorax gibbosus]
MPLNREHALDILGLPTFASESDIILRYKALSLTLYPENHINPKYAEQEFATITQAALSLIYPEKDIGHLDSETMYSFFSHIFFGKQACEAPCCCDSDDSEEKSVKSAFNEELVASFQAAELIEDEERDKNKVEKRRAKKKRRKEKKKLEKLAQDKPTEKNGLKTASHTLDKENAEAKAAPQAISDPSDDEEEDIDCNSAFVSVIAKKHKLHSDIEIKDSSSQKFSKFPKEDPTSIVFRSRQIALRGNTMASNGHYSEAVELFSESIKMDPSDHRFYGNRSYCYDRLGQFERALKDAEKSISLCPVWPKGYFRKGRALLGLKKYAEAENCFVEVLRLDEECDDAVSELRNVKILQVMEMGYSKEHAEYAISQHSTVAEALASLVANKVSQLHIKDDIFISDDENEVMWNSIKKPKIPEHLYDIKRDPNNPEGHNSIWVGNVQPEVTEKKLVTMFSKFGELISVKVMPEKFCAFINYKSKTSPGKAMQKYQGAELSGAKLVIRFPNVPGEAVPVKKKPSSVDGSRPKGAVNGDECYYWRTTGCIYAEQCRFKHKKENKGIDKQKWMNA